MWTNKKPTKNGWYWHYTRGNSIAASMVLVNDGVVWRCGTSISQTLSKNNNEWWFPVSEPNPATPPFEDHPHA